MPRTFSCRFVFQVIVEADDPEPINGWAEQRRQEMRRLLESKDHPYSVSVLGSAPDELSCYEMPDESQHRS